MNDCVVQFHLHKNDKVEKNRCSFIISVNSPRPIPRSAAMGEVQYMHANPSRLVVLNGPQTLGWCSFVVICSILLTVKVVACFMFYLT